MITGIILLLLNLITPQFTEAGQAKLEKMVSDRDALTQQWKESESKKSGIFGNRTKKDMIETNEWLERIIQKDNLIMDELRMIGDIETTTATQTGEDYKAIAFRLEKDVQALKRAVAERDKSMEKMLSTRRTFEWTTTIFFLTTLGLGYWVYKSKKNA
ncbi:Clp protease ClpB [Algoriphagus sp. D3-2-R+10]|uniref:Clp protease ClpB n=1 Tax=Algoriphagus aurantiacus TaxID=3103948 RepID=UPI002B37D44F|nr:Clp protease ClpB [Algoriphagus sp. D3-2-R+10]MEB2776674.1 Clp protease ClpB [Algoriphagus sp. D3-2-R+10]